MSDALTPEASKAIAEAIEIVRHDRFEKYARQTLGKHAAPKDPIFNPADPPKDPKDPPADPPKDPAVPPPPKDPDPAPDPKPVRKSSYWGEILE